MENILIHSGKKRRSGRYKWGSGEEPYQHEPGYKRIRKAKNASKIARASTDALSKIVPIFKNKNANQNLSNEQIAQAFTKAGGDPKQINKLLNAMQVNATKPTAELAKEINNIIKESSHEDINLSNFTNQQLREYIDRKNLENQYIALYNAESERNYKQTAREIIETVGAVSGTALGLTVLIKTLKG